MGLRYSSPFSELNGRAATTLREPRSQSITLKPLKIHFATSNTGWRVWSAWPWIFVIVAMTLALTGAATPPPPPSSSPSDEPIAWVLWIYEAAKSGEWRFALAGGLIVLCELVRRLIAKFKTDLEAQVWWREYGVHWLPIILAVAGAVATDLILHKPTLPSIWRAIGIGATAGQGYKLAVKPLVKLTLRLLEKVWRRLVPPAATTPPAPPASAA